MISVISLLSSHMTNEILPGVHVFQTRQLLLVDGQATAFNMWWSLKRMYCQLSLWAADTSSLPSAVASLNCFFYLIGGFQPSH